MGYLPFKSVKKIFLDNHGNLWFAHESGLAMLSERPFVNLAPSLPNEVVRSLAFMKDGQTYVSGIGTFLVGKQIGNFEYDLTPVALGTNLYPNAICECNNRLWVGGTDDNLYYLEKGKLSRAVNLKSRGGNIFYLFCDRAGEVWVSQAQQFDPIIGILKVNSDLTLVDYNQDKGFSTRMLVTRQGPDGTIYCAGIGDSTYLYRFDSNQNRFENISLPMSFDYGENFEVHDLAIGNDSTIWLASTAGLLRYKKNKIEQIQFDEFYGHEVVAVTLTKENILWASTEENGLVRIDTDGSYSVFDEKAGLPSNIMWYRSLYIDTEGKIWAGSREGLAVSSQPNPSARITSTPIFVSKKVNGKPANESEASFNFHSSLELEFVSPDYPTKNISYQYKFQSKKDDWHEVRSQPLKLEELESGNYAIALRARQIDGSTWSLPLIYSFSINLPWYKSPPAIALYILALFAVIVTSVKIYNRNLLEEKKLLETKVNERTRELSSKNEEILSQNEELKQLSDELHAQNESVIEQKQVIEKQNELLNQSKGELEKKVEERTLELKLSNEEMAQQNVQLEQFAFMTAHNLRAPVARLLGLGSLLDLKKIEDPFSSEVIKRMMRSSEDLDETIREISTILHIKSGIHGIFANINLKKILDSVIQSFHEEIANRGVIIACEFTNTHIINGVEAYVHSIFYNIVSNSLKYADEHRALQIKVTVRETADDKLIVVFCDNGIGFDSTLVQEKIFKPFMRFNTMREGRGLGLYMMKIQMEMMNGCISIESKLNEGTSVILSFAR
ncbi:MAG TPA: hypothetical protein DGG95_12785 [Cytophagales bacterium]|nr:hypothetical protein [Cytophagales bacterium]